MAGSKNNPKNKNATDVVERTCDRCRFTGPIGAKVERVLTSNNGKKKLIWKCKNGC